MFCTDINQRDFLIVHHELGHIYYYIQYKDQPIAFRDGASPGRCSGIINLILTMQNKTKIVIGTA